jgi:hypothetical protein
VPFPTVSSRSPADFVLFFALRQREFIHDSRFASRLASALSLSGAAVAAATFLRFAASLGGVRYRLRLSRALAVVGLALSGLDALSAFLASRTLAIGVLVATIAFLTLAVYVSLAWIARDGAYRPRRRVSRRYA